MGFSPSAFIRLTMSAPYQAAKQRLRQWTKSDEAVLAPNAAVDLTCSGPELMLENMLPAA